MSNKLEKARIGKKFDRRIKIPKQKHKEIITLHAKGMAIRAISRKYSVNKRLIQFILFPERQIKNYQNRLERGGSKQYYNKDKWKLTMREHRHYKRKLLDNGQIGSV